MKRWALLVAGLYVVILAILAVPGIWLAFGLHSGSVSPGQVYLTLPTWLWLGVLGLSQFALLAVPVRVASRQPVTRGPVWRTVLAGGLMAGGLAVGAFLSIYEFVFPDQHRTNWSGWSALSLGALTWVIWALIFLRMSRRVQPNDLVSRLCRWLFTGSVLELLIAVPTHIVARGRNYCCAGFLTFFGLTMGVSVMLFAFGPAVFILYVRRWQRLHPMETEAE